MCSRILGPPVHRRHLKATTTSLSLWPLLRPYSFSSTGHPSLQQKALTGFRGLVPAASYAPLLSCEVHTSLRRGGPYRSLLRSDSYEPGMTNRASENGRQLGGFNGRNPQRSFQRGIAWQLALCRGSAGCALGRDWRLGVGLGGCRRGRGAARRGYRSERPSHSGRGCAAPVSEQQNVVCGLKSNVAYLLACYLRLNNT
jgi:hypothetical protein